MNKGRCSGGPFAGKFMKHDGPVITITRPVLESVILANPRFVPQKIGEYWFNGTRWNWHETPEKETKQ